MQRILVGMFAARRDAERARLALLSQGYDDRHVTIEGDGAHAAPGAHRATPNEPLPEDRGLAGFIGRMFSGATMDPTGIERYRHAIDMGRTLVVVHDGDARRAARAADVLVRHGAYSTDYQDVGHAEPDAEDALPARADRAIGTLGPDVMPLPNAPTGWRKSRGGSPASIGTLHNDPARPEGLTEGATMLGAAADRARLEGRRPSGNGSAPGHDHLPRDESGGRKLQGDPLIGRVEGPGPDEAIDTSETEGDSPDVRGHRSTDPGLGRSLADRGGPQVPRSG